MKNDTTIRSYLSDVDSYRSYREKRWRRFGRCPLDKKVCYIKASIKAILSFGIQDTDDTACDFESPAECRHGSFRQPIGFNINQKDDKEFILKNPMYAEICKVGQRVLRMIQKNNGRITRVELLEKTKWTLKELSNITESMIDIKMIRKVLDKDSQKSIIIFEAIKKKEK